MTRTVCAIGAIIATCAGGLAADLEPKEISLSSLRPDCRIERGAVRGGRMWGAWLTCEKVRFVITGPESLEGLVTIRTAAQAVEFLRVFSSGGTWSLFSHQGRVEVTEGETEQPTRFIVTRDTFRRCCRPLSVEEYEAAKGRAGFLVTRTVVEPDFKVYEEAEAVDRDGVVYVSSKKALPVDGRTLGRFLDLNLM